MNINDRNSQIVIWYLSHGMNISIVGFPIVKINDETIAQAVSIMIHELRFRLKTLVFIF